MTTEPPRERILSLAWWGKRRMAAALPGFLILSLFAHTATFLFFQVVYPEKVLIPQTAPQVVRLIPSSPENTAMLRWIATEDPALAAATPRAEPTGLVQAEYQPFFATSHTPARYMAPAAEKTPFPAGRDPLEIIASAQPHPAQPAEFPTGVRSRIVLSGNLAGRTLTRPPEFAACATAPLEAAQFLIGVTDRGEIRYTFLQRSSGDPAADESAATHLTQASFEPSENPITWGFATVEWGEDAYLSPPLPDTGPAHK